jgi:AcrR family transcriptional regulator
MAAKGEQTRQEIIAAASLLFYRRGYTNTSFSDIVAVTGVQRGNIYHYFKTKDDVLAAVIEQRLVEYEAALGNWDQEYADPKDRLRRFVHMVASNRGELAHYGVPHRHAQRRTRERALRTSGCPQAPVRSVP